jgi:coenzyme PQQ precursor peptide PqqA
MRLALIDAGAYILVTRLGDRRTAQEEERAMKVWSKPAVREQEVGLEVTSYLPAEIDII